MYYKTVFIYSLLHAVTSTSATVLTLTSRLNDEGDYVTLTCLKNTPDLLTVDWMKDGGNLLTSRHVVIGNNNVTMYETDVGDVFTSLIRHTLTMQCNKTRGHGETWKCASGDFVSNGLILCSGDSGTVNINTLPSRLHHVDTGPILVAAVVVSVLGVVSGVVIIFWMCVRRKRRIAKKAIKTRKHVMFLPEVDVRSYYSSSRQSNSSSARYNVVPLNNTYYTYRTPDRPNYYNYVVYI